MLSRRRGEDESRHAKRLGAPSVITGPFLASLPFRPTAAQSRVMAEIDVDLDRDIPMRRLLQGDVGSGKTLVATYCLLRAVEAGCQAALMAPTEVLAEQHATRLAAQLAPLGVEVGLLKGSLSPATRRPLLDALADGRLQVVVGTQALIQEGVRFKNLASVVVDEQHRFGVRQRDVLAAAIEGVWPHVLYMTATPIPRTLSLTLYGDLDLSVIDEMPPGRTPVRTRLVFPEHEGAGVGVRAGSSRQGAAGVRGVPSRGGERSGGGGFGQGVVRGTVHVGSCMATACGSFTVS